MKLSSNTVALLAALLLLSATAGTMARRLQQPVMASSTARSNGGNAQVTSVATGQDGGSATVVGVGEAQEGETVVVDCRLDAGADERLRKICVGEPTTTQESGAASGSTAWDTADRCDQPLGATVVRDLQGKPWGFENDASCAYR
jgi:hypothetical protein